MMLLGALLLVAAAAAFDFKSISNDLGESARSILRSARSAGSTATSIREMHAAIKVLRALNTSGYQNLCGSHCDQITSAFKQATRSLDLYYTFNVGGNCGCNLNFNTKSFILVDEDLEVANITLVSYLIYCYFFQRDDLESLCGAALALKAANKADTAKEIFMKLKSLMKSDGTFKSSPSAPTPSTLNTRLVAHVLAEFSGMWPKPAIDEVLETISQLLPEGDEDVAVDPTLFANIVRASSTKNSFSASRLKLIAENLFHLVQSNDITVAADALDSLLAISTLNLQPIFFSLEKYQFAASERVVLTLRSKNIMGDDVAVEGAEVSSVKKIGKDSNLFQGPMAIEGASMAVDLSDSALYPGRYQLSVSIRVEGRSKAIIREELFAVYGPYNIQGVHFGITGSKKLSLSSLSEVESERGLLGMMKASAFKSESIHVYFAVVAPLMTEKHRFIKPHQVFVRFANVMNGKSRIYLSSWDGKLNDAVGGNYYATVNLVEESMSFDYLSGDYLISILVADFSAEPVEWIVGTVYLELNSEPKKETPLYVKSLLDASDRTLKALPEIAHRMRPPAKRASIIMSTLFTLLSLAPLAAFLFFASTLKLKTSKLLNSIPNVLFVGCVVTALLMYGGYWLGVPGLSFYDTIKYIAVLTPITVIVGRHALMTLAAGK